MSSDIKIMGFVIFLGFTSIFCFSASLRMYDKIVLIKNLCIEKKISDKQCERFLKW